MIDLLKTFSWQELRHHRWRNAAAALAVMLGVALAFSVHLINASALDEFSKAVRSVGGQPDLELRAVQGTFDEALYARVAGNTQVALASPVLEVSTYALSESGERVPLRLVGVDALLVAGVAPALMPQPERGADRMALFAPDTVFLNNAARQRLGGARVQVQSAQQIKTVSVTGSVSAAGGALAVMDIAAAQDLLGRHGQLTRIDLRLQVGVVEPHDGIAQLHRVALLHPEPGDPAQELRTHGHPVGIHKGVIGVDRGETMHIPVRPAARERHDEE